MMKLRNVLLACALGVGSLGAVVAPASAQVYGGVYIQAGPPAPIYETVPVSPGPAYYWVGGYWNWSGVRYVWVRGHYAYRPYAGAIWHGGYWAHGYRGYYWHGGYWAHPHYYHYR